jgi:hypothetical protein
MTNAGRDRGVIILDWYIRSIAEEGHQPRRWPHDGPINVHEAFLDD